MSISQHRLDEIGALVRQYKEEIVRNHGGPTDIIPMVDVIFEGNRRFMGQANDHFGGLLHGGIPLFDLVGGGVRILWAKIERPRLLGLRLVVEGYQRSSDFEGREHYERGDMAHDFATNPASDVTEMVGTYVATGEPDGSMELSMLDQPFHYDDGGVVRWDEPHYIQPGDLTEGNLVDMFRHLFHDIGRADA